MNINLRHILPIIILFLAMSYTGYGQGRRCTEEGYVPCGPNHTCLPREQCRSGNPPPPGLVVPIDDHLPYLLLAGIGLGIFFFAGKGGKVSAFK